MITIGQFIDNMERNGLKQAFGYMIDNHIHPTEACALGQGVINTDWSNDYGEYMYLPAHFADWVMERNDVDKWPIARIAEQARIAFNYLLDQEINDRTDYGVSHRTFSTYRTYRRQWAVDNISAQ